MIMFSRKSPETKPTSEQAKTAPQLTVQPADAEANRFEQIRKTAAESHTRSVSEGARRRARQTAEDNRLI
jgi:hypothetical protein